MRRWKHGLLIGALVGGAVLAGAEAAEARRGGGSKPRHIPRRYYLHRALYDPFLFRGPVMYREGEDGFDRHKENIQLKVSPKNTEVYAGGLLYSKKGGSPRFNLPSGEWKIELRAPGYEPQTIDLKVEQGIKYLIERKLEKVKTPEPAPPKRGDGTERDRPSD